MFKGYYINGVAVKDNGFICFLAKEIRDDLDPVLDEELYKKRLVVYHHNEHGDEQWGNVTRSGRGAMCIATITRPLSQVNVADMNGYIYFYRWFRIYRWFFRKEIYAGGGKGDLWQFNGETWRQVFFSSDMPLESVCCGQDGFVYIGAQCGTVFKGRNDE